LDVEKSIHGFFNNGLSEVNSAKPHKLLDFQVSQLCLSIPGLLGRLFFQQPANSPPKEPEMTEIVTRTDKNCYFSGPFFRRVISNYLIFKLLGVWHARCILLRASTLTIKF